MNEPLHCSDGWIEEIKNVLDANFDLTYAHARAAQCQCKRQN